jgi:hypothetical protein
MQFVPNQNDAHGRLVLLAPNGVEIPRSFARVEIGPRQHERFLSGMQRLRARLYGDDQALRDGEVSRDGRHRQAADHGAWHLLSLDRNGQVCGCSRYVAHSNTVGFSELGVRSAALAHSGDWSMALRVAVAADVAEARRRGIAYAEVGGWALDPAMRGSKEALRIALATYSLARILGGCIGITNATTRHCSAAILRKIGGRPLAVGAAELPSYFDPQYGCEMELLRFDSAEPNPRVESWIEELRQYLTGTLVVQSEAVAEARFEDPTAPGGFTALESFYPRGFKARSLCCAEIANSHVKLIPACDPGRSCSSGMAG